MAHGPASRLTVVYDTSALELSFMTIKCHLYGSMYFFLLLKLEHLYLKVTLLLNCCPGNFLLHLPRGGVATAWLAVLTSSQHQHYPCSFTFLIILMLLSLFMDISKALAALQCDNEHVQCILKEIKTTW